jgi:preprotein translocase subunit SecG
MLLFVTLLHIILCIVLMLVILLQPGKGADVGAAFGGGGGSSTIFGPRGAGSFLSQATTIVAVLFMTTSVTLAIYSNASLRSGSDVENEIRRLQHQDEGEMYTVPEDKQQVAPDLPDEDLFPTEEQPEAVPGATQDDAAGEQPEAGEVQPEAEAGEVQPEAEAGEVQPEAEAGEVQPEPEGDAAPTPGVE